MYPYRKGHKRGNLEAPNLDELVDARPLSDLGAATHGGIIKFSC